MDGIDSSSSSSSSSSLCETITNFKKTLKSGETSELRHESFIENPKLHLKELCSFIGVETSNGYLSDYASIVFKSPNKSRGNLQWNCELIDIVKTKLEKYPFLHGYTYFD